MNLSDKTAPSQTDSISFEFDPEHPPGGNLVDLLAKIA